MLGNPLSQNTTPHPPNQMIKNLYAYTLIVGGIATAAIAVGRPNLISVPIAATGGGLAGVSASNERRRIAETKVREATKVATAFQMSYSRNRGVVMAEEISIYGEIPLEQAVAFLDALAKENNGQPLPSELGTLFVFPHPENAIEALTNNAQQWAQARVEQLQAENQKLKQDMMNIEQKLNAAAAAMAAKNQQVESGRSKLRDDSIDPWNNLL